MLQGAGVHLGISTHALREEGDDGQFVLHFYSLPNFYPRPPRGGRLISPVTSLPASDFYPRPPRGGRRCHLQKSLLFLVISTHALREEGDPADQCRDGLLAISTHALREEGDPRGERPRPHDDISTHALREEGDGTDTASNCWSTEISTHALREEGDVMARLRP